MNNSPNVPIMEAQQVTVAATRWSKYILQNISFKVYQGDRLVIIGAIGAGKTTLLRLFNRLSSPTTGIIYLENQDISTIDVNKLRTNVVLVLQEAKLLGMTVEEAIAYPLRLQNLNKVEIQQRLEYWCNRLRIPQAWLDRNELQLSVGQRQLVAICRALVMQPKVLLLDEPTSALDAGTGENVIKLLIELAEVNKTTILMINHQLELAEKFANRVLYLDNGQVKEDIQNEINWTDFNEKFKQRQQEISDEWE